jgi:hypothetical protein
MKNQLAWLGKSLIATALLTALSTGCGSTASDTLVFRFIRWDGQGITQQDAVGQSNADVDVVQDCCAFNPDGTCSSLEPVTQTSINAIFTNDQASDIHLESYVVHVEDPSSGLADFSGSLSANIRGGRCSSVDQQCASDDDCIVAGGVGTCIHTNTMVNDILLFDFNAKQHVNPAIFGTATSISVTFFGSDPNLSWQTTAGYTVTFADFDNCATSGT